MAINSKLAARLTSPLALLLFASLIAGGVALLAYHYLQKREATMRAELAASSKGRITPKVNVVVPNVNVEANTVLNGERFVSRPVDDDLAADGTRGQASRHLPRPARSSAGGTSGGTAGRGR